MSRMEPIVSAFARIIAEPAIASESSSSRKLAALEGAVSHAILS